MKAEIFRRFSEDGKTQLIIESIDFVRQQKEYYTMKTKEQTLTDNIKCGLGDNIKGVKHHEIMNAMQEYAENYARIQIEKDRVSESELMVQVNIDSKAYDQSDRTCFLEGAETVLRQLRYRPINLD